MAVTHIHSYLVHPSKNEVTQPDISGARVPLSGKLHLMLSGMHDAAANDCDIPVLFRRGADGSQTNDSRNALVAYIRAPTIGHGREIAARLQWSTTLRSGLGLLFLVNGAVGRRKALLVARFPADQGIIAEERRRNLDVKFIERVFMKSAKAYKAAYYAGTSVEAEFWEGQAVDKQLNGPRELSNYWIGDFLDSDLKTTGPAGTKRLAIALREAIRIAPIEVRQELISAANLLRGQDGRYVTAKGLVASLGLSADAGEVLTGALPRPELMGERFQFDRGEFDMHLAYRSVELSNGAVLLAENASFDSVFQKQTVHGGDGEYRFTTEGKIVNEQLRKTK